MFLEHVNFAKEYLGWQQKIEGLWEGSGGRSQKPCQRRSQLPSYGVPNNLRRYVTNNENFANDVVTTKLNKSKLAWKLKLWQRQTNLKL